MPLGENTRRSTSERIHDFEPDVCRILEGNLHGLFTSGIHRFTVLRDQNGIIGWANIYRWRIGWRDSGRRGRRTGGHAWTIGWHKRWTIGRHGRGATGWGKRWTIGGHGRRATGWRKRWTIGGHGGRATRWRKRWAIRRHIGRTGGRATGWRKRWTIRRHVRRTGGIRGSLRRSRAGIKTSTG